MITKSNPPKIIWGEDKNANKITLIVLSVGEKHLNLSSTFPLVHYKILYVFKGIHLLSKEDNIFEEIDLELESLTPWMNSYPVQLSIPIVDNKLTNNFTLSYTKDENKLFYDINENFELSISAIANYTDFYKEEITVKQRYIVTIKSDKPTSFFHLINKAHRFQSFLNMATFNHNSFLSLCLYSSNHFLQLNDNKKIPLPIELFFKQFNKTITNNKSLNENYLFSFHSIEFQFQNLIKEWFSFDKKIMPILHHLIDSIQDKPIFKSTDYLIIAQALDGYHRRFFDKEPEKDKSLESRFRNLKNFFAKEVLIIREIDTEYAANSRNYYSHFYNKLPNEKVAEGIDLFNLTKQLRYLLICCFLHKLGLDNIKINEVLSKHSEH
ncbi:hypothetical protein A1704_03840 [Chryseobacterium cucumeris]|uniref:ApeA N-terminal domain 1-containing protein n=1 Tax=Chryseobacterium cucumeris TaxID=1813611 RepID=UPI000788CBE7|nr:HEPN domain-containing protein [Chryseobacterium cucumeris]KYH07807.1 hypothetical protein A1704_03840 [Chryseobacterium cucumeris]